jgi:hypothetical protein
MSEKKKTDISILKIPRRIACKEGQKNDLLNDSPHEAK